MTCLIVADLSLALLLGFIGAFAGIALRGAHMALTQVLLAELGADHSPPELRGSAYGLFNLATGITLLLASVIVDQRRASHRPAIEHCAGCVNGVHASRVPAQINTKDHKSHRLAPFPFKIPASFSMRRKEANHPIINTVHAVGADQSPY